MGYLLAAAMLAAGQALVPTGATIGPDGYATVLSAPVPGYAKSVRPAARGPQGEAAWYAQDQKISIAEARKRQDEQNALRPRFEKLMAQLRAKEAGNYTDARVVHQPNWAYVLYFKRNPDATLAKYVSHPHLRPRWRPIRERSWRR